MVKRVRALLLFVLGCAALVLLGPTAAVAPALAAFLAGSLALAR
jgi:hypothetical protein